jgi:hypothetical protein
MQFFGVSIHRLGVEAFKQIIKRRAEIIATATTVADIEDSFELTLYLGLVPERLAVKFNCHEKIL